MDQKDQQNRKLIDRSRELRKNMTDAERQLWRHLRGRQLQGYRFRRQMVIGNYIVDFCCPQIKLIVELDGGQHQQQEHYDERRAQWLESQGYIVLRFWNHQMLQQPNAVLSVIHGELK